MTLPPPTVLTRATSYHRDAGLLLEHLAAAGLVPITAGTDGAPRPCDTVLLETADVTTKASRTTVMVLEASARLTCTGPTVTVEALPRAGADGRAAVERVRTALGRYVLSEPAPGPAPQPAPDPDPQRAQQPTQASPRPGGAPASIRAAEQVTLTFPDPPEDGSLEERERLTATSTVEPLRVLAATKVDHPHLPLEAGVLAFDYLATVETLPEVATGANTCPDYLFYDARIILVIDHPTRTATLVGASVDACDLEQRLDELAAAIDTATDAAADTATGQAAARPRALPGHAADSRDSQDANDSEDPAPQPQGPPAAPPRDPAPRAAVPATTLTARPTVSDNDFEALVDQMQGHIAAGDVYQVVPSRGFTMPCPSALAAYHRLRDSNPSPYMFYLGTPDFELLGASPESALLHSARTGRVAIRPIAGTRPRGLAPDGSIDHERDTRLELELRTDAKEVAEHVMLVDLARNDVARVSVAGTRQVDDLMRVDRYSRVMHLVSEVSGQLDADLDALDALRASMTMGTLTGAPKLRAAELIRTAEGVRRGSYGGSVGYLRGDGELDTCIVIRSAFVREGTALVQAGAGVVADSVPAAEAAETLHKARAVLEAVAAAQGARLVIGSSSPEATAREDTDREERP
ncbi:anthranilate synthase component 1 [Actinomyces sp. 2119]|uniref:anthranilate synthase component 1 n=1 Tax=Actinomyces sp. 2119 TaxID=2321393 RepID=UPI000E6CCAC8|nr:anthranilate synthase component 1 [Actinomyces sp. 2119]RJF42457.1 anthranilate synthase component 1 [Actinomyces sp. 2119]